MLFKTHQTLCQVFQSDLFCKVFQSDLFCKVFQWSFCPFFCRPTSFMYILFVWTFNPVIFVRSFYTGFQSGIWYFCPSAVFESCLLIRYFCTIFSIWSFCPGFQWECLIFLLRFLCIGHIILSAYCVGLFCQVSLSGLYCMACLSGLCTSILHTYVGSFCLYIFVLSVCMAGLTSHMTWCFKVWRMKGI